MVNRLPIVPNNSQYAVMRVTGENCEEIVRSKFAPDQESLPSSLREIALDALANGQEVHIYRYNNKTREQALKAAAHHARDPLFTSFTYSDFGITSKAIRKVGGYSKE